MSLKKIQSKSSSLLAVFLSVTLLLSVLALPVQAQITNPESESTGLQGVIPTDPPTQGATISVPNNGQAFGGSPIEVSGLCPAGLLVKVFKNGVFGGSTTCSEGGSYTMQLDLFSGLNTLVARVFDALDQPGPDSNEVDTRLNDSGPEDGVDQLVLTSNFALRGAAPGSTLRWPLALAGGRGPYAVSIDWGDGTIEPLSLSAAGQFRIEHVYDEPGIYKLIIQATDSRGEKAFIQLEAISTGAITQNVAETGEGGEPLPGSSSIRFVTWPLYIMLVFIVSTFWLGRKYEARRIKQRVLSRNPVDL